MKAGDVLHLTRAASVQFVRPVFFRLIKIRTDLHTYHGWVWLEGYELDGRGDAMARRELYVIEAGVRVLPSTTPGRPGAPGRPSAPKRPGTPGRSGTPGGNRKRADGTDTPRTADAAAHRATR
ncbi:hypothetical protein [Micromonospora sp. KC207]|uniref:hypothetical protein n=1 Tax=Micromonospora sp. KC207 TaxID=2530377 RepID=UPI001A9F951C|nr:hypothetical protein [Micromonospora sp. KC207]